MNFAFASIWIPMNSMTKVKYIEATKTKDEIAREIIGILAEMVIAESKELRRAKAFKINSLLVDLII